MLKDTKIYIAGHTGMVGHALRRKLNEAGYRNILVRTRAELDLTDASAVADFFSAEKPEYVYLAAGKTGGIYANNTYRADFLYENMAMQSNVIHQAFLHETHKLLFFACSCIYPKDAAQPISEEALLTGSLEPTNEPFAIAKIAGMKLCEAYNRQYGTDFMTVIPTNLYGPNQSYDPMNALVIPSLIRKFHEAKINNSPQVEIWGSGKQSRDFLFVDELAEASIYLMENFEGNMVLNVGMGREYTIAEIAERVKQEVGFTGEIVFDSSRPDGVARKLQDISKLTALGWRSQVSIQDGLRITYQDYLARFG